MLFIDKIGPPFRMLSISKGAPHREHAAPDSILRLKYRDSGPIVLQLVGGSEARQSSSDHDDRASFQLACHWCSLLKEPEKWLPSASLAGSKMKKDGKDNDGSLLGDRDVFRPL